MTNNTSTDKNYRVRNVRNRKMEKNIARVKYIFVNIV